ncbi:GNAT family N-acetyltransferase [Rhodanobacter aciditrophus]|uniref:GNAT family N-acetyltransferase n=1 Tax=Rhodanobacter aciditrophus TaxID=1623218 RepID=A0ABW4B677_9GAMM
MLGEQLRVRPAELEDAPFILSIFLESEAQTDFKGGVTLYSVIDWIESSSPERPFWVLEYADTVMGWCALESFYGLPSFAGAVELGIYIQAEYQRQRLASGLLEFVEHHAQQMDIHTLVAYILSANLRSQQFFKSCGYEQWGMLPNIARSGGILGDLMVFGKSLS